jgi:surface protein
MKKLINIIHEKLILKKDEDIKKLTFEYQPKNKNELKNIILDKIKNYGYSCNLNDIDTSLIIDMADLFNCNELHDFEGNVSAWDTSNVKYMQNMFKNCKKIKKLNLSYWDVSKVKDMSEMFNNCVSLENLGNIYLWDVSKVKFFIAMFANCPKLNINISNWDYNEKSSKIYMNDKSPNVII